MFSLVWILTIVSLCPTKQIEQPLTLTVICQYSSSSYSKTVLWIAMKAKNPTSSNTTKPPWFSLTLTLQVSDTQTRTDSWSRNYNMLSRKIDARSLICLSLFLELTWPMIIKACWTSCTVADVGGGRINPERSRKYFAPFYRELRLWQLIEATKSIHFICFVAPLLHVTHALEQCIGIGHISQGYLLLCTLVIPHILYDPTVGDYVTSSRSGPIFPISAIDAKELNAFLVCSRQLRRFSRT